MPPVRTNKPSVFPAEATSPLAYLNNGPSTHLNSLPLAPTTPETGAISAPAAKKKRSHGKARPPGHIPRPPNAFIIFRTDYIKSMATQNSTPEVSKSLGERWRKMSPSQKRPWVERAEEAKIQHQIENPGYKYKPVHPRDEFGNCIRKPRKPNRPRVKQTPPGGDMLEHFPESFQWLEGKRDTFPNAALSSDASSASSPPPPSPSPAPSAPTPSTSFYAFHRRSSSVPLAGPDDSFFFGTSTTGSSYAMVPTGGPAGHISRRLSKRPSTSMDFMCAGPSHPEPYDFVNNDPYLPPGDPTQWRLHRRSISAPGLGGEIAATQFTYAPSHNFSQEVNPLTPINPVFGNVFDRFSWNIPQPQTPNTNPSSAPQYAQGDSMYANPSHRQQEYITVEIPSMTNSPTSNISSASAISPPSSRPLSQVQPLCSTTAIQHPAPVATFDFSAFQAQINDFECGATAPEHVQYTSSELENALGLAPQPAVQPDASGLYNGSEHFYGHIRGNLAGATCPTQFSQDNVTAPPSSEVGDTVANLQDYKQGVRYTRRNPEITPPYAIPYDTIEAIQNVQRGHLPNTATPVPTCPRHDTHDLVGTVFPSPIPIPLAV